MIIDGDFATYSQKTTKRRRRHHSQQCNDPSRHCFLFLLLVTLTLTSWPQNKWVASTRDRTFCVKFGDPSCIVFWYIVRKTERQTNSAENLTPAHWRIQGVFNPAMAPIMVLGAWPLPSRRLQKVLKVGGSRRSACFPRSLRSWLYKNTIVYPAEGWPAPGAFRLSGGLSSGFLKNVRLITITKHHKNLFLCGLHSISVLFPCLYSLLVYYVSQSTLSWQLY